MKMYNIVKFSYSNYNICGLITLNPSYITASKYMRKDKNRDPVRPELSILESNIRHADALTPAALEYRPGP